MQMGLLGPGAHGANISLCMGKLAKLWIGQESEICAVKSLLPH